MKSKVDKKKLRIALLKTGFLFGLIVWIYVIAMQIVHPESTGWTFTYWFRIRLGYVGEIAFVVSIISFFFLQYFKTNNSKNPI